MDCDRVLSYLHFPREELGESVITGYWALPRPTGKYYWRFPNTLIDRLKCLVDLDNTYICHLFSGSSMLGQVRVDINPEYHPTHIIDLTKEKLPFPDETFDVVIADPPYYNFPPYSFIPEATRVLRVGGVLIILHQLIYIRPKGFKWYALIGIGRGPNMRITALQIFEKVEHIVNR